MTLSVRAFVNGLNLPAPDEVYYPFRQMARFGMAVVARTTGDAAALHAVIRGAVAEVDKDQPISFFATLESNVAQSLGAQRIVASLTAIFGGSPDKSSVWSCATVSSWSASASSSGSPAPPARPG